MKQIQLRTPSKSTKLNISETNLSIVKQKFKTRYKQSFTQIKNNLWSTSERFNCATKKETETFYKDKNKRSITQIQNKSIKNQIILKRKVSAANQRSIFMNKIKNQILSDNKIPLPQYEYSEFQIPYDITTKEKNKTQTSIPFLQSNYDKFAKTQQFQKKISSQTKDKIYYCTFLSIDKQRKHPKSLQKLLVPNQDLNQKSKDKGLSLNQIKQKKILKYITEFETQTSKQLQQLQKIANDKFHKKSGKIGIALQRISQMRQIKNQIIQNLRKKLLDVMPLNQRQTILPSIVIQNINILKQNSNEQEQQTFQNVKNLSMVQQAPKQTAQQIDNQIQHTVNDYLKDYQQLIQHKKEVYKKFRNQLVYEFPYMLDKYKQYKIDIPDKIFQNQPENNNKRTLKIYNYVQSENIMLKKEKRTNLNDTQLNSSFESTNYKLSKSNQKQESLDTKKLLQLIFKRAYFFSKSKKKVIQTKTPTIQQQKPKQEKSQKRIKYSYLNYLKDKSKNNNLKKLKMTKGQMLIKSKQTILDMQSQGSKQYSNLKKCIDDAIQDCLKQYDKKGSKDASKKIEKQKTNK